MKTALIFVLSVLLLLMTYVAWHNSQPLICEIVEKDNVTYCGVRYGEK